MPELPEVETVVRGLRPLVVGRRFARVVQRRPDLRTKLPRDFARRIEGRVVTGVDRRAKYVLVHLDDGDVLVVHLGMSGRLVAIVRPEHGHWPPAGPHDHIDLEVEGGVLLRFTDARRFGLMDIVPEDRLAHDRRFAGLGPEPLSDAFSGPVLARSLAGRRTAIKLALLDQRIVAGIGNIYACEALFQSGISPRRRAGAIGAERLNLLADAVRDVLTRAIAAGGSSARDYVQASGELGWFQHHWAVYDREGMPCPRPGCGGTVRRLVQGARSTFYCPRCQR